MSRLLVVRHGETDYNRDGRYQGSIDVELNEEGRQQARQLARKLARQLARQPASELTTVPIDRLISSPLKRARETAVIISATLHLEVEQIGEFAERNLGSFEGMTRTEIRMQDPPLAAANITRQLYAAPPGGESLFEFAFRVRRGLDTLKRQVAGQNALLVCHGGVARTLCGLLRRISDEQYFDYHLENCRMDDYELSSD
jgi:probable phosphoglycerate mutase|tara:strand:+ start:76 stop:675 length:600 start_codon:yes stop_codon:yes gene_type:complete